MKSILNIKIKLKNYYFVIARYDEVINFLIDLKIDYWAYFLKLGNIKLNLEFYILNYIEQTPNKWIIY